MFSKRQALTDFYTEVIRKASDCDKGPVRANDLNTLCTIARRLHKIDEDDCSYEYTEAESERRTKREECLVKKAAAIAESLGAVVYHQSDPRGWPLYLIFPGDIAQGFTLESSYNRGTAIPPY